jgi:hypothetical protein
MQKRVGVVGIGVMDEESCSYCGWRGAIYVSEDELEMQPACNNCVGGGKIGEMADVFPISLGTRVRIDGWPVGGKVIGYSDGCPIVQPEAMSMDVPKSRQPCEDCDG